MSVSTLVDTAGSASANTYASRSYADQYHQDRPSDSAGTWGAATPTTKDQALLWATKLLDSLFVWNGNVVTSTQALLWPRSGMYYRNGYPVPSDIIPEELKRATAEFARQLLASDRAADNEVESQGITSLRAGPVALTFKDSVSAKVIPDAVWGLIPPEWGYVRGRSRGYREVVRV